MQLYGECYTPAQNLMRWSVAFVWLGRVWAVLIGLARAVLAVIVLGAFHSPFERTVVAILVIIYASVDAGGIWNRMMFIHQSKLDRNRFLEMIERVGATKYKDDDAKDMIREENEQIERELVKMWIRGAFTAIVYAAAVLTLIGTLSDF